MDFLATPSSWVGRWMKSPEREGVRLANFLVTQLDRLFFGLSKVLGLFFEPKARLANARLYDRDGISFPHPSNWRVVEDISKHERDTHWRRIFVQSPGNSMFMISLAKPLILIFALGCTSTPPVQHYALIPTLSIPADEGLTRAEILAFRLYALDLSAWRATDRIHEAGFELADHGIRGWLVVGDGTMRTVRFIREGEAAPVVLFDVVVDISTTAKGQVTHYPLGDRLALVEQAMWRARQTATASDYQPCSGGYNTIVLREPGSTNWLVYLMSAMEEEHEAVVGRHYRAVVSEAGDSVLELTPLSNTCLRVPYTEKTEFLAFTQLVAEDPLETSILLSLQHDLSVMFSVPSGSIWKADRGRTTLVRDGPAK